MYTQNSDLDKQDRSFRDLIETVFRHRNKGAAFFIAITICALIVLAFSPASYTSECKLIVHAGTESVFVNSAAVGGSTRLYK